MICSLASVGVNLLPLCVRRYACAFLHACAHTRICASGARTILDDEFSARTILDDEFSSALRPSFWTTVSCPRPQSGKRGGKKRMAIRAYNISSCVTPRKAAEQILQNHFSSCKRHLFFCLSPLRDKDLVQSLDHNIKRQTLEDTLPNDLGTAFFMQRSCKRPTQQSPLRFFRRLLFSVYL